MDTKPRTITLKQKFAIGTRLKEVLLERSDGLWEYTPGFNDDSIAKDFGTLPHLVRSVRSRTFGKLYIRGPAMNKSDLEKRVSALEKAFSALDPNWNKIKL